MPINPTPYQWRDPSAIPMRRRINSATVREICGGISDMTLSRWMNDRSFPKPQCRIGRKRYWVETEVEEWIKCQEAGMSASEASEHMGAWRADHYGS